MKRLFSFVLALALVLSLSVTAFAAENVGSITITNVTPEKAYTVYKLFDASYDAVKDSVTYKIPKSNQFYYDLFDEDGKPVATNTCFVINASGNVEKAEGIPDDAVYAYVTSLVTDARTPAADPVTPTVGQTEVTFADLPYGYYVVRSALGATVTITSNTPVASVIDKNQNPGVHGNFNKQVWDAKTQTWTTSNTASVGDLVKYRVTFNGQNYDGQQKIQYYTIYDEKGSALWVEFGTDDARYLQNNIKITVNGETLERGCYLPIGDIADYDPTKWEWDFMGNWGSVEKTRDNAQWYLLHEGYDEFRFVIPWLEGQTVTGEQSTTYDFKFAEDADFRYDSNAEVVIEYCASVEPGAEVGGEEDRNLYNKARLHWTCAKTSGDSAWKGVYTEVFGIALKKLDSKDLSALAGAEFAIFSDEACTVPYNVIPTNIQGVYIKDDLNSDGQQITGDNKLTAREMYKTQVDAYLNGATQKNLVTSPINGKIVILGMDEGTYYLKETKAPPAYNAVNTKFAIEAGANMKDFHIFVKESDGTVADIQAAAGVYVDKQFHITERDVLNSQGVELPATGGEGTMLLVTLGAVVAMAFAVLLITHKKMSIYHD